MLTDSTTDFVLRSCQHYIKKKRNEENFWDPQHVGKNPSLEDRLKKCSPFSDVLSQ
jgi:hypothetical protein